MTLKDDHLHNFPKNSAYSLIYCATGGFAGTNQAVIEVAWSRVSRGSTTAASTTRSTSPLPSTKQLVRTIAPPLILRASWRFLIFGELMRVLRRQREESKTWPQQQQKALDRRPQWVDIAMSGGGAGFTEVFATQAVAAVATSSRQTSCTASPSSSSTSLSWSSMLPSARALVGHTSKLVLCFGTYGYLSTNWSSQQPPKPFWKCWLMGATAGAVGSGAIAVWEGTSGRALWRHAIPRGALGIGTLIAVQVTTCDMALKRFCS